MAAVTFSERQINALSRSTFHNAMRLLRDMIADDHFDAEKMHAVAATADAASAGFVDEESEDETPLEQATASEFNDYIINDRARAVYVAAMTRSQAMIMGETPLNVETLAALAHACDASACGFRDDEDE